MRNTQESWVSFFGMVRDFLYARVHLAVAMEALTSYIHSRLRKTWWLLKLSFAILVNALNHGWNCGG